MQSLTAHLGICVPAPRVSSWAALERSGTFLDIVPDDPCEDRPSLEWQPDTDCPKVVSSRPTTNAAGAMTAIQAEFSEPVAMFSGASLGLSFTDGTPIPFNFALDAGRVKVTLTPAIGAAFPGGTLRLTIRDTITDVTGNQLNGDNIGACGGDYIKEFCSADTAITSFGADLSPRPQFALGEEIRASATGFSRPGAFVDVYVVPWAAAEANPAILIDHTNDGPNTTLAGTLGTANGLGLGYISTPGEYDIIIDVNDNGRYDPSIDRRLGGCGDGVLVGERCDEPLDGIIGHLSFDAAFSARLQADDAAGIVGFTAGSPATVPGVLGAAASFGPLDSLTMPDDGAYDLGTGDFSIEFRVLRRPGTGWTTIARKQGPAGYAIFLSDTGDLSFMLDVPNGQVPGYSAVYPAAGSPITANVWHHVFIVADRDNADELRIYIDGTLNSVHTGIAPVAFDNASPLIIMAPDAARPTCMLDEMCFWESAIPARDVSRLYIDPVGGRCGDALPDCPADFNHDGGIDGADVQAFFLSWEDGAPDADVNQDGGVDGSDVELFFIAWGNGGC